MQMDKDYIEKFDVIRRYHQNRLNDDELSSFEIFILENPEIINVIEKEKILHEAFREHEPLLKENSAGKSGSPLVRGLAMAACLVVAVIAVFSYNGSAPSYSLQPPVILETFRGAGDTAVQVNGQPIVQFQVDMGPADLLEDNTFTAELVNTAGEVFYRVSGLGVDADGWLFFSLQGQQAPVTGAYDVNVYPDNLPGQVTSYSVVFTSP